MKAEVAIRDARPMTMSVEVIVTREFRVRVAVAAFFIKLAARVLRCDCEVVTTNKGQE